MAKVEENKELESGLRAIVGTHAPKSNMIELENDLSRMLLG